MKKLYFLISLVLIAFISYAQKDVYFKINHKLDGNSFDYNQTATNNGGLNPGNQYQLTRLEYYIAEITLKHDSGQTTVISNKWILVDPSSTTNEFLGNYDITNLESITFGVGVEFAVNHNDPSLLPSNHPLASKFPSMHWGWSAGYRFVALEGNTGTNFGQVFQIHALGDQNYRTQTHSISGYLQNGDLVFELDADYNQALNFITIDGNLLYHGEKNESVTLLSNFQKTVFSQSTVGINENKSRNISFSISPNPSSKEIFIRIDPKYNNLSYTVLDLTGRVVSTSTVLENNSLSIEEKGLYILNLFEDDQLIGSKKVIIN